MPSTSNKQVARSLKEAVEQWKRKLVDPCMEKVSHERTHCAVPCLSQCFGWRSRAQLRRGPQRGSAVWPPATQDQLLPPAALQSADTNGTNSGFSNSDQSFSIAVLNAMVWRTLYPNATVQWLGTRKGEKSESVCQDINAKSPTTCTDPAQHMIEHVQHNSR